LRALLALAGLLTVGCGDDKVAVVTPAIMCPENPIAAGDMTVTIQSNGMERSYILHVPTVIDLTMPAPLVLNYHGLGSNAAQQVAFSNLNAVADVEGFIVAYPEGLSQSFNAGSCCSAFASPPHMEDDGAFTREIIADIATKLCVDDRRIYSTGMSNGAYMSEYNACVNADIFAAVAPVSGMGFTQPVCEPSRPVPMIAFNGTADTLVMYDGSVSSVDDWLVRDGCTGAPVRTDYGMSFCDSWTACEGGSELTHCTLTGMGHCWPGVSFCPYGSVNLEIDASVELWKFLSRFTLPQ
jgi:polyhydroxybutyrate depolymerase